MDIRIIPAYDRSDDIRSLFAEYTDMLIRGDSDFAQYLAIQNYDAEIQDLTCKYGLPHGRLYLALCDGEVAGCIALRRLNEQECELKRLYVRPAFRRRGIAAQLVDTILADARAIGYRRILLDTLPFLQRAIDMYRRLGFVEIPSYNNSPLDTTIFMAMDL